MQYNNNYWLIGTIGLIFFTIAYFFLNPSYERSLEAKFHYAMGDYKQAQELATEAFEMNAYNRMASTIMTQSQTAMKFVNYIEESKKYMNEIAKIASGDGVSRSDRAKVKIMCEIMIASHVKISATVLTDKDLIREAKEYNDKFKKLHDDITSRQ
jgi:tetratricopeptide (TPR) repeat protein